MKINIKKQYNYLFYLLILFLLIFLIKKIFFGHHKKKHYKHTNYNKHDRPLHIINTETKNTIGTPYVFQNNMNSKDDNYDLYEPRFIAPRYYDTQLLMHKQPVYVRTYGYRPMKHNKNKRKYKMYSKDDSSSDSSDSEM